SKEDIVGVVTALEYWFGERDTAAERQKWYDDCAAVAERLGQLDGLHGEVVDPEGIDRVPRLKIVWDRGRYPLNGLELRGRVLEGRLQGVLDGDTVRFSFGARYEASNMSYRFEGRVSNGTMAGTVELGAASDQNAGIVNRTQFGSGAWQARRLA